MTLQALGYIGIRTRKLEDWSAYATRFLGLQLVERSRNALAFRMDDRKQRIVVEAEQGEGPSFYGWEVENAKALDELKAEEPGRVGAPVLELFGADPDIAQGLQIHCESPDRTT